jgi:hypothetical protein
MTDSELDELLTDCPVLYHMAEGSSWQSIRDNGLLSTTALLNRYKISGSEREAIGSRRRPTNVCLESSDLGRAVVRDQSSMDDAGLRRCLDDGLSPVDWYQLLNTKVFFWFARERLLRLLNARTYRHQEHDVLVLDAKSLIKDYRNKVWLCPINSGCTKPFPCSRGHETFRRIPDYPYELWKTKRKRGERVVELAVDHAVPDGARFVTRVVRMKAKEELSIYSEFR